MNSGPTGNPAPQNVDAFLGRRERSGFSCTLTTASIGPALGVKAADRLAVRPISLKINSKSSPIFFLI